MDAVIAAVRPKQQGTYSHDFRPQSYDILLTEELALNDQIVKCLPMTQLSFEEEPSECLCGFLHELSGGELGGLKGKRAIFIPAAENEPVTPQDFPSGSGTLYCVPVDSRDKLHPSSANLADSPAFYSLDQVLETLTTKPDTYSKQAGFLLHRIFHWFRHKEKVPGAMNLLFSSFTEERLKRSITNPAYFTETQLACLSGVESVQMSEGYSRAIANEALAKMMEIEKCDIIKINTVFGQDMPFKSKVDTCIVNKYWGMGKPDYAQMSVPPDEEENIDNMLPDLSSPIVTDEFPLHKYASEGKADRVLTLLKSGSNVTELDDQSWAPIHHAAWFGHLNVMQTLISEGTCSPNITNGNGSTALHLAASQGHCYVIELLLNHNDIDLNALDDDDRTALNLCDNVNKPDCQSAAQLLRNAMSKPMPTIKISLMDGTWRLLSLVSGANTTVQQLHQQMMNETEIPEAFTDVFTLWICSRNLQLQLKPEHKPIQHLNDWKRKIVQWLTFCDPSHEDPMLFWRRHASLSLEFEKKKLWHPIAIRLLFYEAYHNYITSFYPCSTQDAVILGGILLQLHHGDYDQRKTRSSIISDTALVQLIPHFKRQDKSLNWSKELMNQYKEFSRRLKNRSVTLLHTQFLKLCRNLKVYGSAFFTGQVQLKNKRELTNIIIGVNDIGVHIIVVQTMNMLQTFGYDHITWYYDKDHDLLKLQYKEQSRSGMRIKTKQAGLVKHLMDKMAQQKPTQNTT